MVERPKQAEQQSPEGKIETLLELKRQAKEKLLRFREEFATLVKDENVPMAVVLLDIERGLSSDKLIITDRGEEKAVILEQEKWVFMAQRQFPENVFPMLSPDLNSKINNLASAIGIGAVDVLDAAIKTKVLLDNFQSVNDPKNGRPLFLEFNGGPEGLRLEDNFLVFIDKEGKVVPLGREGHRLEYYFSFGRIKGKPVRSLLLPVPLAKVDFPSLFPEVLLMTTLLIKQKAALNPQNPAGETDQLKN